MEVALSWNLAFVKTRNIGFGEKIINMTYEKNQN